jgi:hypothetical protein
MKRTNFLGACAAFFVASMVLVAVISGCSTSPGRAGFGDPVEAGTGPDDNRSCVGSFQGCDGGADAAKPCVGLECEIHTCSGAKTRVMGKVFDPGGKTPLYNVVVYIPNSEPAPIVQGASCDKCGATALNPVPKAELTNEKGEFIIDGAPDGEAIPLVMQIGKWRRQTTIKVTKCIDNKFEDPTVMRLPAKQSEGDMPKIALSTGGFDALGCLFSRMGIAASEFTGSDKAGAVHVYKGFDGESATTGVSLPSESGLWQTPEKLKRYDIVLLSCEGEPHDQTKPTAAKNALKDYLNLGGRVFATHYHATWFKNGAPELQGLATWSGGFSGFGTGYTIDQSFPKGKAMADWLFNVGATPTKGMIALTDVTSEVGDLKAGSGAQRWISGPGAANAAKYFSFNTPVTAKPEDQCGRGVMSDIHVSATRGVGTIPGGCGNAPLTPQERALEFMFFDLSSCVQRDDVPPIVPK